MSFHSFSKNYEDQKITESFLFQVCRHSILCASVSLLVLTSSLIVVHHGTHRAKMGTGPATQAILNWWTFSRHALTHDAIEMN